MHPGFEFEQRIQRQNARYGGQDQRHKQTVNRGDRAKENNPENAEQGNEGKKQRERQVHRFPDGIYNRNGGAVSPGFGSRARTQARVSRQSPISFSPSARVCSNKRTRWRVCSNS